MIKPEELDYALEFEARPDVEVLLNQTILGTEGGFSYRHMDTSERLNHLIGPEFLVLRKDGKAVGTSAYCKRSLRSGGIAHESWYIRYFSVKRDLRGQGIGTHLHSFAEAHYRKVDFPAVFYAFIELKNARSLAVSKTYRMQPIAYFRSVLFSRFFPKKSELVRRVSEAEKPLILQKLEATYANHQLVDFGKTFLNDQYFALYRNGEPVAGCMVNDVHWKIEHIPGFGGWMTMNVVPWIPILGRLFSPKAYRFLAFESVFCKPGHEADLHTLFESLLAEFGRYTAMLFMDVNCPVRKQVLDGGNLGFLSKVQKSPKVSIIAEYHQFKEEDVEKIKDRPVFISAFDLI